MQYGKTLKILICLLLIIPILNIGQASANTNYDHEELMQYQGYAQAMYESIVEQTTYISGQYTNNQEYVKGSIDQVKDYASFWKNEFDNAINACQTSGTVLGCWGDWAQRGGAYVLTVGDWIKKLFSDYDETIPPLEQPEVDYSFFETGLSFYSNNYVVVDSGWTAIVTAPNGIERTVQSGQPIGAFFVPGHFNPVNYYYQLYVVNNVIFETSKWYVTSEEMTSRQQQWNSEGQSLGGVMKHIYQMGASVKLVFNGEEHNFTPSNPPSTSRPITNINKYVQDNPISVPVPELAPTLVCPDGTKIKMAVSGSTFLSSSGSVMNVNKDGTAEIDGAICNLNWDKPKIDYIDGKASMIDPNGNWLDVANGNINACLDPNGCKPAELDNSLLEYVKNAYQYATNFLKTATDGLKSLATGAKDLTGLFGTFFSWLPSEMVVLMSSGLGIVIGLRLFRK